ncbi:hypothetical protein SF83666_b52620 (plasmid) [Sinorhizobium fredii CCBAU 83666]|nr:hypothetical protein SF83666_b52620 [Sinorhizobium fredii CCBAU 83666]
MRALAGSPIEIGMDGPSRSSRQDFTSLKDRRLQAEAASSALTRAPFGSASVELVGKRLAIGRELERA